MDFSCSTAYRILAPPPGIESTSPALQGRFLTTEPQGKSLDLSSIFIHSWVISSSLMALNIISTLMTLEFTPSAPTSRLICPTVYFTSSLGWLICISNLIMDKLNSAFLPNSFLAWSSPSQEVAAPCIHLLRPKL